MERPFLIRENPLFLWPWLQIALPSAGASHAARGTCDLLDGASEWKSHGDFVRSYQLW